jgi:hypothetical protein
MHPTTGQAAGMFSMNLANWRENEFVKNHHSKEETVSLVHNRFTHCAYHRWSCNCRTAGNGSIGIA